MLATSIMRLGCSLGCEPAQPVDNPAFAWIETVPPVVGHRKEHAVPALLICRELADDIGLPTHGSLESRSGRGKQVRIAASSQRLDAPPIFGPFDQLGWNSGAAIPRDQTISHRTGDP